jgi:isocitrate dehydrogenase kinase/phosphatase
MSLLHEQPDPRPADGDVWAEIIATTDDEQLRALYVERRAQGVSRYGVPLQRGNGRDHYADAIQELADAVVYLQAANMTPARRAVERTLLRLLKEA